MPRCTGSGASALPADSPLFVFAPVVCMQYPQYTPRVPRPAPERAGRRARDGQAVDAPALPPRHAVFVGFSPGLFAKRPPAPRRSALQLPHGSAGALVCLHFVFLYNSRRPMALSRRRFASSDSASRLCGPRRGADPAALFLSLRTSAPAVLHLRLPSCALRGALGSDRKPIQKLLSAAVAAAKTKICYHNRRTWYAVL